MTELEIHLLTPHAQQRKFIKSRAKRKVVRAGRRGGKTVGVGDLALEEFLDGKRILYGAPTSEQVDRFWTTVTTALAAPIAAGVFYKNETEHIIELPGTEQRIRAKTCWSPDTLRGDYADLLILDEWQLMSESTWNEVGAPMLLDNNGDAVFVYTPPSLHNRNRSKAIDPQHAAKMYKKAAEDTTGRWGVFTFTSHDNPYLSKIALEEITGDMTAQAYRMEILAEDIDESPGALWTRAMIENARVLKAPELSRIVVAIDPSATSTGDEAGIITMGKAGDHIYTLADDSIQASPLQWATAAVTAYYRWKADCIIAESNNGGEMITQTIRNIDPAIRVRLVSASRGKMTRADPIAAVAEQGKDHHVGSFPALEDQLCIWLPGDPSPNRLDAKVWAASALLNKGDMKKATSHAG